MSSDRYPKRKRGEDEDLGRATRSAKKTAPETLLNSALPPPRGKRLIPAVVNQLGSISKDKIWIRVAKAHGTTFSYEDVTYGTLANAVNRTALWLQHNLGPKSDEVYAYLGPSDARYLLLVIAAAKIGCCMFLPSPHNSRDSQRQLLEDTRSVVLLHTASHATEVPNIIEDTGMVHRLVPSQEELLDRTPVVDVTYTVTQKDVKSKPFVILHTSGSTGTPKPVPIPHSYYEYEDLSRTARYTEGYNTITSSPFNSDLTCLVTAPLWHAGGMFFGLLKPLLHSVVAILPPPDLPITADLVASCLTSSKAEMLQAAPSVAADLATEPSYASVVRSLRSIIIGSGPMAKSAGDQLLRLNASTLHYFGATETDLLPLLRLDDPVQDWQYHHFHPLGGVSFEPLGGGLYELVIKRLEGVPQPFFEVFPDAQTYSSKDVFSRHPKKPDLWRSEGRRDDMIVLSTGEKMSPTALENAVTGLPGITGALVVGKGQSQAALLIELDNTIARDGVLGPVWPAVQEANSALPAFGRIVRPLISVAVQPFERSPKGTIKRRETERRFAEQIDDMYRKYDIIVPQTAPLKTAPSETDIFDFVSSAHAAISQIKLHPDDDIFASDIDSMQVAKMVHILNTGLSESHDPAAQAVRLFAGHLYTHRSVAGITQALHGKITQARHDNPRVLRTKHVSALQKHLTRLPQTSSRIPCQYLAVPLSEVVLTGSTGSLGTHLLHALLRSYDVKHVYCLDRSPSAPEAYLETFPMDEALLSKVSFYRIKTLTKARFGLDQHTYGRLYDRVTAIIHNAWPVNFQLPLESSDFTNSSTETLDAHVGGIATLIDFAAEAEHHPRIVFISSLAAVLRCSGNIPEAVVGDPSVPEGSGYAQSKWMGEQLLGAAAKLGTIRPPIIIRPGQIAGPLPHAEVIKGSGSTWDVKQTVPSLILSSAAISALPQSLGEKNKLRWIPVDVCAQSVIEVAGRQEQSPSTRTADVYNLINVATTSKELIWTEDLLPLVHERLQAASPERSVRVIPLDEWYHRMVEYGSRKDNPAFRLLDFLQDLVGSDEHAGLGTDISIDITKRASEAFRNLQGIQKEWMEYWMKGWNL